ncbi:hypothetical protein IV203_015009 [Nitzschia inconspicua]|uniref:Secreted protein n=1 Tax=Nitzschia inconspicua TaxID=303405 RepID=A0A9K3PT35_9STRA|nr:hypothetical protein IV203_015009 [Nitzschia inconspicua]
MSLLWRWFVNLLCFLGASSANLPCSPYALFASPAFALSTTGSHETARAARDVIFDLDSAQLTKGFSQLDSLACGLHRYTYPMQRSLPWARQRVCNASRNRRLACG